MPIAVEGEKSPCLVGRYHDQGRRGHVAAARRKATVAEANVRVLAPEVTLAASKETTKFGAEAVPVVLKPGVKVHASDVQQYFVPGDSTRRIPSSSPAARRPSRWRSTCIAVSGRCRLCRDQIGVSLVTRPKPGRGTEESGDGPHADPRRRAVPLVREAALVGGNRRRSPDRNQHHFLLGWKHGIRTSSADLVFRRFSVVDLRAIDCGAGIYALQVPTDVQINLKASWPDAPWFFLHADIWWGAVMAVVGAGYCYRFHPWRPGETITGRAN